MWNGKVTNNDIWRSWYLGTVTSYGIILADACQDLRITDNYIYKWRHAISIGKTGDNGVPRKIICTGNNAEGTYDSSAYGAGAYDAHYPTQYITYSNNTASHCRTGLGVHGLNCIVTNNTVFAKGGIGVQSNFGHKLNTIIANNNITIQAGWQLHGIYLNGDGLLVQGNIIDIISSGGNLQTDIGIIASDNDFVPGHDIIIANNIITGMTAGGIYLDGTWRAQVTGNILTNNQVYGIVMRKLAASGVNTVDILNNTITDNTSRMSYGIRAENTGHTNINLGGNYITGAVTSVDVDSTFRNVRPYQVGSLIVGSGGNEIAKQLNGYFAWPSTNIASGDIKCQTIEVPGATYGDTVMVGMHEIAIPSGIMMTAAVSAPDIVQVTILNKTLDTVNIGFSNQLRVSVWKH